MTATPALAPEPPVAAATRPARLRMPRVNANEDAATVVAARVAPGERFERGALLFELETTKATVEVEAPFAGTVTAVPVESGRDYAVGDVLLHADVEADEADETDGGEDWDFTQPEAVADEVEEGPSVSLKARLRARELGVDLAAITVQGRIGVAEVEAHHARAAPPIVSAEPAGLPETFGTHDVLMVGEGGHALTLADAARGTGLHVAHRASLRPDAAGAALLAALRERGLGAALLGVGGATSNAARAALFAFLQENGLALPAVVAPSAHLGEGSRLGAATYLFAGAVVGPAVTLGDDCIVNHGAVVCHDTVVGSHVHLTPGATVAGACRIGDLCTIGMNASIMNGVSVGPRALVHNNAAVARDVAADAVVTA